MIKEINRNDVSECVMVIRNSFLSVADEFGFTRDNAPGFTAFAISEDRLYYQLDNEHRLMYAYYSDNDKIIGYYSLLLQDNQECELNNLCVLPQYRHKHFGADLLSDAYLRAKESDCKKINIGIVEENKVLRKWYEDNGFIHIGIKKFDFFPFTSGYMERIL